ncbi:MAG: cupredoxin domain-containing protein [Acidobacteriota bacterium]|nr:cupredoxin domain-containing protein [Acidobacteriota bacterium]
MKISHDTIRYAAPAALAVLAAAVVAGCGSSSNASKPAASTAPSTTAAQAQQVRMDIQPGAKHGSQEWPRFVPGTFTVKAGEPVTLTIVNRDDGAAPLSALLAKEYDSVKGGTETVDGAAVTSVPNANVSHTFTIPGLGVNAVIPTAPKGGANTVVITFTPAKSGTFTWHCYAPCGEGKEGNTGAMEASGWMEGKVTVTS